MSDWPHHKMSLEDRIAEALEKPEEAPETPTPSGSSAEETAEGNKEKATEPEEKAATVRTPKKIVSEPFIWTEFRGDEEITYQLDIDG